MRLAMWTTAEEMLKAADAVLSEALGFGYMSIGIEYQEEAMSKVVKFQCQLEQSRENSISRNDEASANLAWILAAFAQGVHEFISMWVYLKQDQMESAWNALVTAQECLGNALRLRYAQGLYQLNRKLYAAEIVLFPPCKFISSSILYGSAECSICHEEYGECDHVAGKLYMGEMCCKIIRKIMHIDHVAIVDHPEDKRLRFPALANGKDRGSLTHRERITPNDNLEVTTPEHCS
jgi:hypothetical protein